MDELRANPFAPRICELFSEDGSGSLTFTNFLDMKSAFSKKVSPEVRLVWAFALWDFDGDDLIGIPDVKCGVDLITNSTTYINETALPLKEDDLLEMLDPYQLEEVRRSPNKLVFAGCGCTSAHSCSDMHTYVEGERGEREG